MRFARATVGASAASLFLVDADTLRGLASEWDWTRTSFVSRLREWPTVERALVAGELCTITAGDAAGNEAVWFEPRGIVSAVCVPLRAAGDALGVVFFDFDGDRSDPSDRPFLSDFGARLGRALGRDRSWAAREAPGPSSG